MVAVLAAILGVAGFTPLVAAQGTTPGRVSSLDDVVVGEGPRVEGSMSFRGVVVEDVSVQTVFPSRVVTVREGSGREILVTADGGFDAEGDYWEEATAARLPMGYEVSLSLNEVSSDHHAYLQEAGYSLPDGAVLYEVAGRGDGEEIFERDSGVARSASSFERSIDGEYRWPDGTATVQLYTYGAPDTLTRADQVNALRGALSMWNLDVCTSIQAVYGGEIPDVKFLEPGALPSEGEIIGKTSVWWDAESFIKDPGTLGKTWKSYSGNGNYIKASVITLNSEKQFAVPAVKYTLMYDLQTLMAHETGHALGFDHISKADTVMNRSLGTGVALRSLTPEEQSKVADRYPCGGVSGFDDGTFKVTQSCTYFDANAPWHSAGTALASFNVIAPPDGVGWADDLDWYEVSAAWARGDSKKIVTTKKDAETRVSFSGRRPGEVVTLTTRYKGNQLYYHQRVPALGCSVPLRVEGSTKVPVDPSELAGVSVGQQCDETSGRKVVELLPVITNNTASPQSYVLEWSWYGRGFGEAFRWPSDQPKPFTIVAQNFYTKDGTPGRQKLTLAPGETAPFGSAVLTGRRNGQVIGLRVLRDSAFSEGTPRQQRFEDPVDGTEVFKATIKASACDELKESVDVVQDCQFKRTGENNERLQVVVTNGREVSNSNFAYDVVFNDATTGRKIASRRLTVDQGRSEIATLTRRRPGERIRVTVNSELRSRGTYSFVETLDSCNADYK